MEPEIQNGQWLVTQKVTQPTQHAPEYWLNKIVIFKHPQTKELTVKRVLLIPDDIIRLDRGNLIYKNQLLPVSHQEWNELKTMSTVPQNKIFVVGDNWFFSEDSREFGFIPIASIEQEVVFIY